MRFARRMAVLALLGLGAGARAEVAVRERRITARVAARDAIRGALLGSPVAGGVYAMGIQDHSDYDAVIEGAELVLGRVDPSGSSGTSSRSPVRDGLSMSMDVRSRDQSNTRLFPVVLRGF